jgi:hypothetical protein
VQDPKAARANCVADSEVYAVATVVHQIAGTSHSADEAVPGAPADEAVPGAPASGPYVPGEQAINT